MNNEPWLSIFNGLDIFKHDFAKNPFFISAQDIKNNTTQFSKTNEREVRVLCKQDTRKDRPDVFKELELFILPVNNGEYAIIKGEGYVDIPNIITSIINYDSKIDFELETSFVGNSEMQHLDYAYATSLIRTVLQDPSLVLTIP